MNDIEESYIANLNDIVTPREVHDFADSVSVQAIMEACRKGYIDARKSGGTWLMRRSDAVARWGLRGAVPRGLGVLERFSAGDE